MTFTLAHLSDPHVGPPPVPGWRELIGKRLTGYWNWHHHRHTIHNMDVLAKIVDDVIAAAPDHVALTGDLVNLGLAAEFPLANRHVARLGDAKGMSMIPGNHDAYVGESLRLMGQTFAPFMTGDEGQFGFPYLRMRQDIALIGLSSAVPTLPFMATGAMGAAQIARFDTMLHTVRQTARATVVMIHHPPHVGGARMFRGLKDAAALETVLGRHGADLVLHGHNHKRSLAHLAGPNGSRIPVVGVASCSAVPGDPAHRAAWHLYRFTERAGRMAIHLDVRGMATPHADVTLLDSAEIA